MTIFAPQNPAKVLGNGEMSEWSIEHAWKACVPQGTEGSNPSLSANILKVEQIRPRADFSFPRIPYAKLA